MASIPTSTVIVENTTLNINTHINSSVSMTTLQPNSNPETYFVLFTKIICVLVLIMGLVGNSLVLTVFGFRWSKLKSCELLMISLACSDLIGSVVIPSKLILELMNQNFYAIGNEGCKIISFLSITSLTVSAVTLVAISIDRYIIIKWPFHKQTNRFKLYCIIGFTWLLASGIGLIYLFPGHIKLYKTMPGVYNCRTYLTDAEYKAHALVTFSVQVALPLIIITLIYMWILFELRRSVKELLLYTAASNIRMRLLRNQKATKLLIIIILVFYICVLPLNLFFILYLFNIHSLSVHSTLIVFSFLQILQMVNSCVNPIIYSKLHRSFRRIILKLLSTCSARKYNWKSFRKGFSSTLFMLVRSKNRVPSITRGTSTFNVVPQSPDTSVERKTSNKQWNTNNISRSRCCVRSSCLIGASEEKFKEDIPMTACQK